MNFSSWIMLEDPIDDTSRKEVGKLIQLFLLIIPIVAIVLAIVNFILGLTEIALTTLVVPLVCGISLLFLVRGFTNMSIVIIVSTLIVTTTISCVLGNGIHETGIIIFPVIVIFSSIVMNVRGILITTIAVTLCLALLVFGEMYGLFPSQQVPEARIVDLAVVLSVTIVHIFITYSFSKISKDSLNRVKAELATQERLRGEIAENLTAKSELLRLVHHRVKNNLLLINSLIELETYGTPKAKSELSEIIESIHTIARAHDPLYHTEDYKQVEIRPYLEKLIVTFSQSARFENVKSDLQDGLLFHEKALLLGIILQKILNRIGTSDITKIQISLKVKKDDFKLEVSSRELGDFPQSHKSLIKLLAEQLEAKLTIKPTKIVISFRSEAAD
ncbi:histidine kinase dimerization/phosphoacceptor domain -containing protein [Ekhidna sp.]|uniref:histidine kinase dimerization/phosphoacceptor domain -containing protein n=1 Tax=Ekhidna sp. TaxID=2608089 RepID=UPI003513CA02